MEHADAQELTQKLEAGEVPLAEVIHAALRSNEAAITALQAQVLEKKDRRAAERTSGKSFTKRIEGETRFVWEEVCWGVVDEKKIHMDRGPAALRSYRFQLRGTTEVLILPVDKDLVALRIPAKHQPDLSGLPDNVRVMDPDLRWVMAFEPERCFAKRGG